MARWRIADVLWRNRSGRGRLVIVATTLLLVLWGMADGPDDARAGEDFGRRDRTAAPLDRERLPSTAPDRRETGRTTPPASPPPTSAPADGPGYTVTHVVDGDTIDVTGGVRVRLIGIDTPERGACGATEATAALRALVDGRRVVLVPGARDDVDRYGRLLRYVEVDGVDVNLEMLRQGRAVARYDSRDGYGAHARERAYIQADAATPGHDARCANGAGSPGAGPPSGVQPAPAAPVPFAAPASPTPGRSDPRFGTCTESKAAGFGPYRAGVDPEYDWYRDADHDGLVCE